MSPAKAVEPDVPIAVIGLSCRFPGDASTPSRFWDLLKNGRSGFSEKNPRVNVDAFYHPQSDGKRQNVVATKGGFFLSENPYLFDAGFFNITAAEADSIDPRQRIALEVAYEAIENAGLTLQDVAGTQTACFMGASMSDYRDSISRDFQNYPKYHILGVSDEMIANRISHFFDIHGPSAAIETACSSSLVATHIACQALRTGEADMAIAGGVGLSLATEGTTHLNNLGFLNPAGQSRSFDADAGGYARGEGCGVVLLKRLDQAIEDGDNIRSIIRATGVNSDGWTRGITFPSSDAQTALIKRVYAKNGLDFGATQYVEAHGTGTKAGDPIEASAIYNTIGQGKNRNKLYIGSVKTNIGHLEAAAGVASIIKGTLALEHGMIPPNLNFKTPNPDIPLDKWKMVVPTKLTPWPPAQTKRLSISGFGMGGTNGHVVMEAYTGRSSSSGGASAAREDCKRLFTLSSHDKAGFERIGKALADHLDNLGAAASNPTYLANLAYTLGKARSGLSWKSSVFAEDIGELREQLTGSLGQDAVKGPSKAPRLGFVFTGQGAQWARMGIELLDRPIFAASVQRSAEYLKELGADWDAITELSKEADNSQLGKPMLSQPICSVIQIGLVDELRSWGVIPTKVCGHSSGEIGAAYAAGALSHRDALAVAYFRGVHSSAPKMKEYNGGMMAVGCSRSDAQGYIEELGIDATVACVNSPTSVTVSGIVKNLDILKAKLDEKSIFARRLKVEVAYHSPQMHSCSMDYYSDIAEVGAPESDEESDEGSVVMVSSVNGSEVEASELGPYYWVQNLISPVLFTDAVKELVLPGDGDGSNTVDVLLELGPHSALGGPIEQILAEHGINNVKYLSMLTRGTNALDTTMNLAADLFAQGVPINIAHVNGDKGCKLLTDLPPYAWNHSEEFRADGRIQREQYAQKFPTESLLGAMQPTMDETARVWRSFIKLNDEPWLRGHEVGGSVLFPAAGMISLALEAVQQIMDTRKKAFSFKIRDTSFLASMMLVDNEPTEVVVTMRPHLLSTKGTSSTPWWEFTICSCTGPTAQLRENCRGLIDVIYADDRSPDMQREESIVAEKRIAQYKSTLDNCQNSCDKSEFYRRFANAGINYGEVWQGVEDCRTGHNETAFNIRINDIGETFTRGKLERPFLIHAATLDAAWQGYLGSTCDESGSGEFTISKPMVPVSLGELEIAADIPWTVDTVLPSTATSYRHGLTGLCASVTMFNEEASEVVFATTDYELAPLEIDEDDETTKAAAEIEEITSELRWDFSLSSLKAAEIDSVLANAKLQSVNESLLRFAEIVIHHRPGLSLVELANDSKGLKDTIASKLPFGAIDAAQVQYAVCHTESDFSSTQFDDLFGTPFALSNSADEEHVADLILIPGEIKSNEALEAEIEKLLQNAKNGTHLALAASASTTLKDVIESIGFKLLGVTKEEAGIAIFHRAEEEQKVNDVQSDDANVGVVKILESNQASSNAKDFSAKLSKSLEASGFKVESTDQLTGPDSDVTYISLLEIDQPMLETISPTDFENVQKLLMGSKRFLWLTRGNHPSFGTIDGLFSSINMETGSRQFQVLHLSEKGLNNGAELVLRVLTTSSLAEENHLREKDGLLQVPRIYRDLQEHHHIENHFFDHIQQASLVDDKALFQLTIGEPGMMKTLHYTREELPKPSTLGDDELEIDVKASGVNFRDIMASMDLVDSDGLGVEASGIVRRVGKNAATRFKTGDRVVTLSLGGAHATKTRCDYRVTAVLQDSMSFEEAAASATIHATANMTLVKLARARKGQSVLIHAAAGGVGQAAIQWANRLGLKIYATVGTDDKREFISEAYGIPDEHIFNSRDTSFVAGIKRVTNGRGVDCILDSLTGELLTASMSCLAPFGTFIEIGTRDITDNMRLDMRPFSRGTTFSSFDIPTYIQGNPEVLGEALQESFELLGSGELHAPSPLTVLPAGQAEEAFRTVQQGKHRGKLVLSFDDEEKSQAPVMCKAKDSLKLDSNATYLLIGGLGGLGRSLAKEFVASGAKYIAFLSRSGDSKPEAKTTVRELEELGAHVKILKADIGDKTSFFTAMNECSGIPPIKGIIQMAMVLRDGPFERMSYDDWVMATRPKIQGSQHLNEYFDSKRPIDFMIFCSSVAGVIGTQGQSQYAAANTYLDALAHYRRSQGLKAVSIDLGFMLDNGVLMEMGDHTYKAYEPVLGISERAFHALFKSVINGQLKVRSNDDKGIPAQVSTGFGTFDKIAASGLAQPPWMSDARFGPLAVVRSAEGASAAGKAAGASVSASLTDAGSKKDFAAAWQVIETALIAKLADLLRVPAAEIEASRALYTYGVDSLVALEVRNWIKHEVKASVGLLEILAAVPITEFAAALAKKSKFMES